MTGIGERFATTIASRDREALAAMLASDVDFKGLTPGRLWEAGTPDEVVDVILGHWFEESDRIERIVAIDVGEDVGDVGRVTYRFDLDSEGVRKVTEQQAYFRQQDGRLSYLRMICSGFRPRPT